VVKREKREQKGVSVKCGERSDERKEECKKEKVELEECHTLSFHFWQVNN
jgi:hypothetical protein